MFPGIHAVSDPNRLAESGRTLTYGVLDRSSASIATAERGLSWSGTDRVAAELITYVRDRIGRGNAPRTVYFVDRLPRLATGKPAKRKLQEQYAEARR